MNAVRILLITLLAAAVTVNAASSTKACENTPKGQLYPDGGKVVLKLKSVKGYRLFWCNNSLIEKNGKGNPHGDGKAELMSTDGMWKGNLLYRKQDGLPQWTLKHKKTGDSIKVVAKAKPEARADPGNNDPMTWDRRDVIFSRGTAKKMAWVVRTNTTSGDLPGDTCNGDIDVKVPFTATYEFFVC